MAIDTEKLHAILTAAQNPAFKKLIDERSKKLEEKTKIEADIVTLDEKIADTIPPELLALLTPSASTKSPKTRKPAVETTPAPAVAPASPAAAVVESRAVKTED